MPAHDDKISLALILDDLEEGVRRLAREVLDGAVHTVYIGPVRCGTVHAVGKQLAEVLRNGPSESPALTMGQRDELRHLRGSYAFRAETDPRVSIHESEELGGWTVICEEDALFAIACTPSQLYLKPVPSHWSEALFLVEPQLAGAAIWPEGAALRGLPEMPIRVLGN